MFEAARRGSIDLRADQVRDILIETAQKGPPFLVEWDSRYGHGRVSAAEAVKMVDKDGCRHRPGSPARCKAIGFETGRKGEPQDQVSLLSHGRSPQLRGHLLGDGFGRMRFINLNPKNALLIERKPVGVSLAYGLFIRRQWSHLSILFDSPPTQFNRRVEPNGRALLRHQFAVLIFRDRSAARSDHGLPSVRRIAQSLGLDPPKPFLSTGPTVDLPQAIKPIRKN